MDTFQEGDIKGTIGEEDFTCPAMAFADDLILLCDREEEAQLQINSTTAFLKARGMLINPKKCHCISAVRNGTPWCYRSRPLLTVGGTKISMTSYLCPMKYLGHQYNLGGMSKPSLANLPSWLYNINAANLKPDQKLLLVRDHVIPRLTFALQTTRITSKSLRGVDRLVRMWVKRMLHLNVHTPDAVIHASIRDGGIGILETRTAIPNTFLKRLIRIRENDFHPN